MKWAPIAAETPEERKRLARDIRHLRSVIPNLVHNSSGCHLIPMAVNAIARFQAMQFSLADTRGGTPVSHRALADSIVGLSMKGTKYPLSGYLMDAALDYGVARVEDFTSETVAVLRKRAHSDSIERELLVRYCDATGVAFSR